MNCEKLKELWKKEEDMSFKGWDFSYLENRWDCESLPWNYKDIVLQYLKPNYKLLDIGTGGGEFLLSLNHPYKNTSVTEMWEPNVKLCKDKLGRIGIDVNRVLKDEELPFNDNSFDIIIKRQASYNIQEVKRILKPNGFFITQQVGGLNNKKLCNFLIENHVPKYKEKNLKNSMKDAIENNFSILYSEEYFPYYRFKDIGALVYYARIIVWEFPKFSVDKYFEELLRLNKTLSENDYIESLGHRYIMICKNVE